MSCFISKFGAGHSTRGLSPVCCVMYKIVISINNGAKIKNVFLKEKIFG